MRKFKVVESGSWTGIGEFDIGDIITLSQDDGSKMKEYKSKNGVHAWIRDDAVKEIKGVKMAKANKDGWIRHRGGKCPVDKGTLIDVRYRDGYIESEIPALEDSSPKDRGAYDWSHTDSTYDILAYRICQPEQQKEAEVKETAETLRARYLATFEEKKALEVTVAARQNDIAMIEKEQEELRGKVRALGFDFYDAPKVEEDMSDQKNWKVGDLVTCTEDRWSGFTKGKQYELLEIVDNGTWLRVKKGDNGHENGANVYSFKFHSRPK